MRRAALLLLCSAIAGCVGPSRIMRAGLPCDPRWDNIDYKRYVQEQLQQARQPVSEEVFGACVEDDLANRSVEEHTGNHHHKR